MNQGLTKNYTEVEVFKALKQMSSSKAPRPNGMTPIFFQRFWPVVGKLVTTAVLKALNNCEFPSSLNHSFITLIPNKKSLVKVVYFRPINLCNVVYKLISKVIVNRLKNVIPCLILDSQSAFVPWRLITNNTLVA